MMKRHIFAASLLAFLAPASAWAACTNPIPAADKNGATVNLEAQAGPGGNCVPENVLVQGGALVAAANGLFVQPGTSTTWAATQSGTWTVQPGNTANTTPWLATINQGGNSASVSAGGALLVNGTGGTFPISGTVAVTQSTSPWIVAGGGTAGSAATGVLTVQGIASMTHLLVTPDANSAVNVAQFGGSNVVTGTGTGGSGIPRVTISSDSSLAANQSVNLAQVAGTTTDTNSGNLSAGTQRTVLATNSPSIAGAGQVATGAAPPASAVYLGANASGATGGHVAGLISCDSHVFKHITSATDTLAVQGVTGQTIYICSWRARAAGVATWYLENTASTNANCSSSNTQITGVATEAANTGETWGTNFWSGLKNTSANGLCINSTGTGGVDVDLFYAQF